MELTLEKFTAKDFDDYFRLVSDAKVMAMITERAIPLAEARLDYEKLLGLNNLNAELGQFRILDPQQRHFIGLAKLEVIRPDAETAELGYMILPEYWGRGIASQVACMLILKAECQPHLKNITAIIDPANLPSRKILIKNGFTSLEFKDFDGLPGEILQRHCKNRP